MNENVLDAPSIPIKLVDPAGLAVENAGCGELVVFLLGTGGNRRERMSASARHVRAVAWLAFPRAA